MVFDFHEDTAWVTVKLLEGQCSSVLHFVWTKQLKVGLPVSTALGGDTFEIELTEVPASVRMGRKAWHVKLDWSCTTRFKSHKIPSLNSISWQILHSRCMITPDDFAQSWHLVGSSLSEDILFSLSDHLRLKKSDHLWPGHFVTPEHEYSPPARYARSTHTDTCRQKTLSTGGSTSR